MLILMADKSLSLILKTNTNPIQLFDAFIDRRPVTFKLASFVRFSHRSNTVLLPLHFLNSLGITFTKDLKSNNNNNNTKIYNVHIVKQ